MSLLTNIKPGRRVILSSISGGRHAEIRLTEMGFLPGVEIHVISNSGSGPLTVNIKGSKLALGHGLAKKLLVKEAHHA